MLRTAGERFELLVLAAADGCLFFVVICLVDVWNSSAVNQAFALDLAAILVFGLWRVMDDCAKQIGFLSRQLR